MPENGDRPPHRFGIGGGEAISGHAGPAPDGSILPEDRIVMSVGSPNERDARHLAWDDAVGLIQRMDALEQEGQPLMPALRAPLLEIVDRVSDDIEACEDELGGEQAQRLRRQVGALQDRVRALGGAGGVPNRDPLGSQVRTVLSDIFDLLNRLASPG